MLTEEFGMIQNAIIKIMWQIGESSSRIKEANVELATAFEWMTADAGAQYLELIIASRRARHGQPFDRFLMDVCVKPAYSKDTTVFAET